MKKIFYLFFIFSTLFLVANGQTFEWANVQNFGMMAQEAESMGIDKNGNTYISGYGYDGFIFTSNKNSFISKYNDSGTLEWWKPIKTANFKRAKLSVDSIGNCYISGLYKDSITIGNFVLNSGQEYTSFIAKINSNGDWLWAKDFLFNLTPFNSDAMLLAISTLENGFCILGAYSESPYVNHGKCGFFISKYNVNGDTIWNRMLPSGGTLTNYHRIKTDENNNIYIAAPYVDSLVFPGKTLYASSNMPENFIAKYDLNGVLLWAKNLGNYGLEDIAVDKNENTYALGIFNQSNNVIENITLQCIGNSNRCLIKYSSDGTLFWAKSEGSGVLFENSYLHLATDKENNIYMSGQFFNSIFGDTTVEGTRAFLIKYDENFNLIRIYRANIERNATNTGWDGALTTRGGHCIDDEGNIYVSGNFTGKVGFGSQVYDTGDPGNNVDMFVCKFKSDADIMTANESVEMKNDLIIYPNPTAGIFQINYSSPESTNLQLNVINSKGEKIYEESVSQFQGEYKKDIDLSKQAKGVYFIEVIADAKKRSVKKIVMD